MAVYLGECRRMGSRVLPPDVNESEMNFTPVGADIRFGLSAVRNVGANVVGLMSAERERHGKATSFHDFLDKAPLQACNKRLIESLIKAGAFDSLGHPRRALMEIFETAVDQVIDVKRNEANGQDDLFGAFVDDSDPAGPAQQQVPDLPDWDKATKLAFEREMLGLYVSDHPLQGLEHILAAEREISIGALVAEDGPRDVSTAIAGMITSIVRKTTKNGDYMAILSVEDLEAGVEVVLFPKEYALVSTVLATDTVVRIRGRVRAREDSVTMQAQEVTIPEVDRGPGRPVVISLPATRCTAPVVAELRQVLRSHPGLTEVQLRLRTNDKTSLWRIDNRLRVTPSPPLMADLKALLGPSCLNA